MMIGPNHEITADRFNWILTEWTDGTDKEGNPKRRGHNTFHGTIEQACQSFVDRSAEDAAVGDAQDIIAAICHARDTITRAVKLAGVTRESVNGG